MLKVNDSVTVVKDSFDRSGYSIIVGQKGRIIDVKNNTQQKYQVLLKNLMTLHFYEHELEIIQ